MTAVVIVAVIAFGLALSAFLTAVYLAWTGPGHHKGPSRPVPMIPRRVTPRAAGGAPATAPTRAGAPEVPALPVPAPGAGASPHLPDAAPGEVTAPASPGAAARRDTWVTWQDPPGTPQVTVSGKPAWTVVSDWRGEWAIEHGSGTVTRAGHWRGGAGRDTIAMPAVADRPRETPYYLAHLAWQDQAAGVIA